MKNKEEKSEKNIQKKSDQIPELRYICPDYFYEFQEAF